MKEDDYDFQKMMRDRQIRREDEQLAYDRKREEEQLAYDRARQDKFDDDQLDANRSQRQIDKLQAMAQMQAQMDAQKYQHEQNIAQINANERMNRDNNMVNMSAEQIRAAQLDRLSSEAQVAMAQAYGSDKEAALLREQAERERMMADRDREYAQRDKADMMNFAKEMAAMMRDTASNVSMAQQQRIDALQTENRYQQQRTDKIQDTAMSNISQVSTAAASNINAYNGGINNSGPSVQPMQQEIIECQCYNCGHMIRIATGTPQCPDCGAPFQW
jgi:rubrerythrin